MMFARWVLLTVALLFAWATDDIIEVSSVKMMVVLKNNGGQDDTEFHRVDLPANYALMRETEILNFFQREVPQLFESKGPLAQHRIMTELGTVCDTLSNIKWSDSLYVVPPGREFLWPFFSLGHKVNVPGLDKDDVYIESLGKAPALFYLHNFFTHAEADEMIATTLNITENTKSLARSTTGTITREVEQAAGFTEFDEYRTSENAWDGDSAISQKLWKRSFALTRVKEDRAKLDGMQVLRYKTAQFYDVHHDYFQVGSEGENFNYDPSTGGSNRFATVFLFLSDVEEGGQTAFPHLDHLTDDQLLAVSPSLYSQLISHKEKDHAGQLAAELLQGRKNEELMVKNKCYEKMSIKPKKGDAILFYSVTADWALDKNSKHGGCPVLQGTKWAANIWIWNKQRAGYIGPNSDVQILFTNNYETVGTLYWVAAGNTLIRQAEIKSGGGYDVNTYASHTFAFKINDVEVYRHTVKNKDQYTPDVKDRTGKILLSIDLTNRRTVPPPPSFVAWNAKDGEEAKPPDSVPEHVAAAEL